MKKKKIKRLSGIKERVIYRDAYRRFATRENSVSEEYWRYREAVVKGKKKTVDLRIEALPYGHGEVNYYSSIQIPDTGKFAGRLSSSRALNKAIREIGVSRHDTHVMITMTAKTDHGRIVKRKMDFWHYNSRKLNERTIGEIINRMFYDYDDRPAYPVKIVKGWRKRESTKRETENRRQLYEVKFHIVTDHSETRKQAEKRKGKKK